MPACPPILPATGPLVVTGASGRVARLLRPFWGDHVTWWSRSDGPLEDRLAGARTILALGGATSGDATALAANVSAARTAVDAAAGSEGVTRVLLLSSSAVYGRRDGPLTEDMAPTPSTPYGSAKAELEAMAADWPQGALDICVLRLGNVAGADALLGRLGPKPPKLDTFPDGATPRRSYVGPETLARLFAALADHPGPLPRILNLGTPGRVAMGDLLCAAGRDWETVPAPDTALRDVALDVSRLAQIFPFTPQMSDPATMVAEWRRATQP